MKAQPPFPKRVCDAVRRRREALNLSQEAFADSIKMHRAYYGFIERGKKDIRMSTLARLCVGLGMRPADLIRDADA